MTRARRGALRVVALVAALSLATAAVLVRASEELEQPRFDVLDDLGNHVELRRYRPATWVATDVDETSLEKAQLVGFQRLFAYISGNNELERKIEMTKPVVVTVRTDAEGDFRNFTVAFFLPSEFQPSRRKGEIKVTAAAGPEDAAAAKGGSVRRRREEDEGVEPPAPRDDRVRIVKQGETELYSLPFGSYALGFRVKRLSSDFFDWLERGGRRDFEDRLFQVAVYDPPYQVLDRRNEIWALRQR